jgi:beta-N-acetylhexosaminidase
VTGAPPRALIVGCAGTELSDDERLVFAEIDPLGFILFARNVLDPTQLRRLTASLRASVSRRDAPILIDQEGGRVQRLRPPHWRAAPAPSRFAAMPLSEAQRRRAVRLNARLIAIELAAVGIDVDCTPVADLRFVGAHDVIGDRAYGQAPELVAALAREAAEGLIDVGVTPVLKHLPGHGRAVVDSHLELPHVDAPIEALRAADFRPFRELRDLPWAMTAHLRYAAIDAVLPGTLSPAVVAIIRNEIGFGGFLITDDLAMGALGGRLEERAAAAIAAGCDCVLHCSGVLDETRRLAAVVGALDESAQRRLAHARAQARPRVAPEPSRWRGEFDALGSGIAA